ncbi:MAG: hypothetical protein CM1200mP10_33550 [Candidatus Neomarinimicrobiota bacterium]|nr:MAG: hypothetical protein CM1200mP10_33550 [Candidatus Neomarinimicrobiota bacterium]
MGPVLFDLDNDTDLDLFFANGHLNSVSGTTASLIFYSKMMVAVNSPIFSQRSGVLSTGNRIHRSAIFADYDDDGRVDVFVTVTDSRWKMVKAIIFSIPTKVRDSISQ